MRQRRAAAAGGVVEQLPEQVGDARLLPEEVVERLARRAGQGGEGLDERIAVARDRELESGRAEGDDRVQLRDRDVEFVAIDPATEELPLPEPREKASRPLRSGVHCARRCTRSRRDRPALRTRRPTRRAPRHAGRLPARRSRRRSRAGRSCSSRKSSCGGDERIRAAGIVPAARTIEVVPVFVFVALLGRWFRRPRKRAPDRSSRSRALKVLSGLFGGGA